MISKFIVKLSSKIFAHQVKMTIFISQEYIRFLEYEEALNIVRQKKVNIS